MKKELFISHASEDKDNFVRPLANLLNEYGINLWYDEFELRLGSSISRSIDKGIKNSKYGLIVLSKSFFSKNWTEYELKSLNSFEIESGDVLLPIWKDVTVNEVRDFSPYLADKFALTTKESIEELAIKIIEVVNPNLFSEIHQKIKVQEALKNAKIRTIDPGKVRPGPIRHPKLNENLISRIRLIRSSLWLCYPHSMNFWVEGFQRDLNIEQEIRYWEHIGSCFLEIFLQQDLTKHYKGQNEDLYKNLFSVLFNPNNSKASEDFDKEFIERVKEIISFDLPVYDLEEPSVFELMNKGE